MGVSKYMRMRRNKKGFTLIEMMVVIGIIAILAMVAIPSFSVWIPDFALKGAAQDLYSNMQLAKMAAVKEKEDQNMEFDTGAGTYKKHDGTVVVLSSYGHDVKFGNGNATSAMEAGGFDDNVTYEATASVADNIASFNSRGMANNAGYVYLTNSKGTAYAVGSLTSGVILLRKWKGSSWE